MTNWKASETMGTMRTILCSRQRRRLGTLGRAGVGILGFLGSLAGCTEVVVSEQTNKPDAGRDGGSDMKDGGVTPVPLSWRWESPQPQGNNLRALWGIAGATMNDDVLYAAGESGTVLVGGATGWQLQRSAALDTRTVLGLAGQGTGASAVVLAVGQYDLGLRRQNGQWSDLNPILGTGDGALNAIWATPTTGDFYAVGTTGRIYAIHNSGGSWVREGMGVTPDTLFAINGVPGTGSGAATEAYAVGANGRIVHRQGGNWTVEADSLVGQNLNAVWCGDGATAGQVFAAGDGGVFLVRKAGGGWAPETTPSSAQLTALWGAGDELYSVGAGGTVLQRKGGTWKQEAMGLTGELLSALWGTVRAGQTTVYAIGNQSTILRRNCRVGVISGSCTEMSVSISAKRASRVAAPSSRLTRSTSCWISARTASARARLAKPVMTSCCCATWRCTVSGSISSRQPSWPAWPTTSASAM